MLEKSKRRRFQLHLSTCMLLMATSGLLIWVNTIPYDPNYEGEAYLYGWPFKFYEVDRYNINHHVKPDAYFKAKPLAFDLLFLIVAQALVAWCYERFIPKRILKTRDGH